MIELGLFIEKYYQATRIPISIFDGKNLLYKGEHTIQDYNLPLYIVNSLPETLPDIWYSSTPEYLYFGGLNIKESDNNNANGTLLFLGPVLVNHCSPKQAEAIMHRLGRKVNDAASYKHSCDISPLFSVSMLCSNLILLSEILLSKDFSHIDMIDFRWADIFHSPKETIPEAATSNTDMDNLEEAILSMVKNGKVRDLRIIFNESKTYHNPETGIATRSLSKRKNYLLGANGIASRVALKAGVASEVINPISDYYMDEITRTNSISELSIIFQKFMLDYTTQVQKVNEPQFEGQLERKIAHYVQSHIYEKLSTSKIAGALGFTSPYLSSGFKSATGMSVTDFIKKQKIKEAKYLLDCHAYSISEISELLCFSSQSYFGNIFKEETGMTPLEYQELN